MVGVAKRVRTIEGIPTMKVSMIPPIPAIRVIHDGRRVAPGSGWNKNQLPMIVNTIPTPVHTRGMPTCTSMAKATIANTSSAIAQVLVGSAPRP